MSQVSHPSVSIRPADKRRLDKLAKAQGKLRWQVVREALDCLEMCHHAGPPTPAAKPANSTH